MNICQRSKSSSIDRDICSPFHSPDNRNSVPDALISVPWNPVPRPQGVM